MDLAHPYTLPSYPPIIHWLSVQLFPAFFHVSHIYTWTLLAGTLPVAAISIPEVFSPFAFRVALAFYSIVDIAVL
jgi:hypothetical protein